MKEAFVKLKKMAVLLFFIGIATIFFSNNSAANVYADSYEDQYAKDPYTIETGKVKKNSFVKIEGTDYAWGEAVLNSLGILSESNPRVTLISADAVDQIWKFRLSSDTGEDNIIQISYNVRVGGYYGYYYISGFSYDVLNSADAFDSDGDNIKDCLRFDIKSSQAKNSEKYNKKPYCSSLIIYPYNCYISIDPNGGSFKNDVTGPKNFLVNVGTTFNDLITSNSDIFSDASDDYGFTRSKDEYEYKLIGFSTYKYDTTPGISINDAYMFNQGITLYAVWEMVKCRVTINANGGSLKNGEGSFTTYVPFGTTLNQIITDNSDVLSSASDNYGIEDYVGNYYGFKFVGFSFFSWTDSPDISITESYKFNDYETIYAIYKEYMVVTFVNGITGETDTQWLKPNSFIQEPEEPTAEGREFMGWYYSAGYSAGLHNNPSSPLVHQFNFDETYSKNITLYAGWQVKGTLYGYNGKLLNEFYLPLNFAGDREIYTSALFDDNPPEGKVFTGWYSDKECKNLVMNEGDDIWADEDYKNYTDITKNFTLYAGYADKVDDFEVSVKAPKCGTRVTSTTSNLYPLSLDNQTGVPVATVSDDKKYTVAATYLLDNNGGLYNGIINGEDTYKGLVILKAKPGYGFSYDEVVGVNLETKSSTTSTALRHDLIAFEFTVKPEHDWNAGEITKKPTCKMMGIKTFKCNHCPATKTEDIDMTEHKWGKGVVVREATSEKTGLKSYTCEICGDAKYEDIPKLTSAGLSKKESEAVDQLNKEIDYLPDADDVTLENAEKIKELVKEYDKMSEKQKEVIQGDKIKKLMQAYNKITILELEAADPDSEMNTDKAVNVLSDGGDLKNSTFADLQVKSKAKKNSITLTWNKVSDAKGYLVYGNLCGKKNKMIKLKATTDTKLVLDKINGKAIEGGKYYKFIVVAYKDTQKFKHNVALSKSLHVATPGGKYTNVKKLNIKKTKVSIKKGKKYTIKAKFTKENKKLEAKRHTGLNGIRFESSNPSVAKVNNKGVVTGKKKGKATIYVYAQNGVCKKVKITVK